MGDRLYFEDFAVGDRFPFGGRTVTKADIIDFASRYDPQPFHVDETAADESTFGGLVASGWHTAALVSEMLFPVYRNFAFAGGRGVDELRWSHPVRPGDTLSGETEVIRKAPVNAERGNVDFRTTAENQDGTAVFSLVSLQMMERR